VLNPQEVEPGQYGMYKSKFRYQTGFGRKAPDIRFKEAGDLVAFGTLVALEDMKIAGGDIYLKRALDQSLENQKSGANLTLTGTKGGAVVETAFRPADFDADPTNDLELEILLGDLAAAKFIGGGPWPAAKTRPARARALFLQPPYLGGAGGAGRVV